MRLLRLLGGALKLLLEKEGEHDVRAMATLDMVERRTKKVVMPIREKLRKRKAAKKQKAEAESLKRRCTQSRLSQLLQNALPDAGDAAAGAAPSTEAPPVACSGTGGQDAAWRWEAGRLRLVPELPIEARS